MSDIRTPPPVPSSTPIVADQIINDIWQTWCSLLVTGFMDMEDVLTAIEDRFYGREIWLGIVSPQTATSWGTPTTIGVFTATSGNNAYGADANDEALVVGSADTPIVTGKTKFSVTGLFIAASSAAVGFKLRVVYGTGTMAAAIAASQFTTVMVSASSRNPVMISMPKVDVGTQVWVQAWCGTNDATITFLAAIHEYDN